MSIGAAKAADAATIAANVILLRLQSRDPRLDVAADATSPSSNRTCGFPAYGFPLSAFPVAMDFFLSWAVEHDIIAQIPRRQAEDLAGLVPPGPRAPLLFDDEHEAGFRHAQNQIVPVAS